MKKYVTFIGTLIVSIVLVSCSSAKIENTAPASSKVKKIKYNEDRYIDAYNSRDYKTCLGMLSYKTKRKADIRDNLDIAMLNFLLGDYETASGCFETIDEQMFEAVTKSITKTFADLCKLINPAADTVIAAKVVSVLPYFIIALYKSQ